MVKLLLRLGISLGIGALFIWLVVSKFDFGQLFAADNRYQWEGARLVALSAGGAIVWSLAFWVLLPVVPMLVAVHFVKIWRWKLLLAPLQRFSFWEVNKVGSVGFMAVILFPLRLGEFVRPYLIAAGGRLTMSEAMATIVVERVFDGVFTSFFLFIGLQFIPRGTGSAGAMLTVGTYIAMAVFFGASLVLLLTYFWREWVFRVLGATLGRISAKLNKAICAILDAFFMGLTTLKHPRYFPGFVLLTLAYWAINGTMITLLARGFGIDVTIFAGYILMCTLVIGIMIPGPPGQAGNFEAAIVIPLAIFAPLSGSANGAFALGLHLLFFIQPVLFGLYFVLSGKVTFRRLVASTQTPNLES